MSIGECALNLPKEGKAVKLNFNQNKMGSYCGVHAIVDTGNDANDPDAVFSELRRTARDRVVNVFTPPLNMHELTRTLNCSSKEKTAISRVLAMLRTKELSNKDHLVTVQDKELQLKLWTTASITGVIEEAFPDMQVVILTSNPYLLSSLHKERVYIYDGDSGFYNPTWQTKGSDAEMILAYIFDYGDEFKAEERDWVEHYNGLATQGLYETDVAKELLKRITDHFGETHYMTQRATSATRLARLKENLSKVRRN